LKEILYSKIHYCPVRKSNRLIDLKSAYARWSIRKVYISCLK
jgi:hypothetical protein